MNGVWRVVAVGALVLIAGCSGTSSAGTGPSLSSGPVSTATVPAQPAPTRPPDEGTPEGAVEFAYYFWALYNHAYATLDAAPLEAVSDKECKFCASVVDGIAANIANKDRLTGSEVEVLTAVSPPDKVSKKTLVTAALRQQPGQVSRPDGSISKDAGWKRLVAYVAVTWDGTRWTVRGVDLDEKTGERWPG